jgi:hypothetical protein
MMGLEQDSDEAASTIASKAAGEGYDLGPAGRREGRRDRGVGRLGEREFPESAPIGER